MTIETLAKFVEERYEPARIWQDGLLLKYIAWADDNGFLFTVHKDDGTLEGAALARPVSDFPRRDDEFDRDGDILYVDFIVADNKRAFQALGVILLTAFKQCNAVTFQRFRRGDDLKVYPASQVRKHFFKTKH